MPRYSPVAFNVQPVEFDGEVQGFVVSGFLNKTQLQTLREMVDDEDYERSKKWRGQYQEMAKAIVSAIDTV